IDLRTAGYGDTARSQFYEAAVEALRQLPGVRGAALTGMTPLSGTMYITGFRVPGAEDAAASGAALDLRRMMSGDFPVSISAGPEYFASIGTPVLQGRDFRSGDRAGDRPVAIVNATFAKQYWPGDSPVGRCIDIGDGDAATCHTVVGVVADAKYVQIEEEGRPAFFL